MTSETATREEFPLVPRLGDVCHYTGNLTGHWAYFDQEEPDDTAFFSGQSQLPSDSSGDSSVQGITRLESGSILIKLRPRLEFEGAESATISLGWPLPFSEFTAWLVWPNIEESPYGAASSIDPLDIQARIAKFRALQDGWHDGFGSAPNKEGLEWLGKHAAHSLCDSPNPYVYPTPEGGVQFEWDIGTFRPSLEINLETRVGEWHCLDLDSDESQERELQLDRLQDWQWLEERLLLLQGRAK